jgi:hypothetical protein
MRLKILLYVIVLTLCSNKSNGQDWSWGLKATGNSQVYHDADINVDVDGNMVIAGYYQQNLSYGNLSLFTEDDYFSDIYLTRINANKEVEWLISIDTGSWTYDYDIAVTVDDDDNIYLTGGKNGDIFVAKYDVLGNEIWTNNFNSEQNGYGTTIGIDQFDNVYVAGGDGWNFFMAKLNDMGETEWIKDFWHNSSNACNVRDIAVDALGDIYFVGVFDIGTLVLDDVTLVHDGSNGDDMFWGKLDTDGNFIWVKSSTNKVHQNPQIALTADNHLYLSGSAYTLGIVIDGFTIPGICCQNPKPFIAKCTTDGEVAWALPAYTTHQEKGLTADIKVDNASNLYLVGSYFTAYGLLSTENDIYVEKYNPQGVHQWRKEITTYSSDFVNAVDIDNAGYCYVMGTTVAKDFINQAESTAKNVGVGQLNTMGSTYKKTERPKIARTHVVCGINAVIVLVAEGANIKWYSDPSATNLVYSGNEYNLSPSQNEILYVTQTVNNIESWPKQVFVNISTINAAALSFDGSSLSVTYNENYQYQWFYQENLLATNISNAIVVTEGTLYTDYEVIISEGNCEVQLSGQNLGNPNYPDTSSIVVYPNPASDNLFIDMGNPSLQAEEISVVDISGKQIARMKAKENSGTLSVDLSQYEGGMYFVKIVGRGFGRTVKVVKR